MRYLILIALVLLSGCIRKTQLESEAVNCAQWVLSHPGWSRQELDECFTDRNLTPPWNEGRPIPPSN
jgi:murein L,D-transpeptidase YcbB/YkuD